LVKRLITCLGIVLVVAIAASLAVQAAAHADEKTELPRPDTSIWTQAYWLEMARLGLVEVAPDIATREAVYTSSRIDAAGVLTEDSPDVPVTTDPSTTQSENSIFVNPQDNSAVLNANNSTDCPFTQVYGASGFCTTDSGQTWYGDIQGVCPMSYCDPAAAIGLNGRYYVNYVAIGWGQGCAYSTDGGTTWTHVQIAGGGWVRDKNHLWVDNSLTSPHEGNVYSAWLNYQGGANHCDIELTRSTDDGLSWSSPLNISSAVGAGYYNHGPNLQTGPSGEVYAVWAIYDSWPDDENALGFAKSTDGGVSFAPGTRIIDNIRGIRVTRTSKNMRVNSFPVMAVDISDGPYRGNIYVVWSNVGTPGVNVGRDIDVYMITSTDGGTSWSAPARVNQDPPGLGKEHYFPWITCDPASGALCVVLYDDRNVASTDCEVFVALSLDGGVTWTDFKVSDVSFTPQPIAGMSSDYFGDYIGISARGGMVYPVWTDNRDGRAMAYVSPFAIEAPVPPAAITDLTATVAGSALRLSWSPVTEDEQGNPVVVDHYVIYRSENPSFSPVPADSIGGTAGTSYDDETAAIMDPSTNHYFNVKAADADGRLSADSNTVGEFDFDLATYLWDAGGASASGPTGRRTR
jgi:hypothetical protein